MKNKLEDYAGKKEIKVVSVWSDNEFLKPVKKEENGFIKELGLDNKFIVMYSGNLGKTHNVEVMIELAKKIKDNKIFFLIIGQGDKYVKIKNIILETDLKNIILLPWQPTEKLPFTLSSADLAVITLGTEAADLSIPSKTFNFMSVGVPILGICKEDSSLAELINSLKIGRVFSSDKLNEIADFISALKNDKNLYSTFAENSFRASEKFTSKNALEFVKNV